MKNDLENAELSTLIERLAQIRSQVGHENDLLNHRLTWLWALQGLLFAGVGLAPSQGDIFVSLLLCIVGLVSCISIGYILHVGRLILDVLNVQSADLSRFVDSKLGLPPAGITGKEGRHIQWLFPWILLPWFMAVVWLILAAYFAFFKL